MTRVAVLTGGRSLERQVSLKSGGRVEDALQRLGHEPVSIDVGDDLVERLATERPDVAFMALHGRDGEDGSVQELLELVGIPYTGSGPAACMRCWDKVVAKYSMIDAGLPTPEFFAFSQAAFEELGAAQALPRIEQRLAFPIVVKPASQGSALGIRMVRSGDQLPSAIVAAFSYDTRVLLERHVTGRDLAVSVLGGPASPTVLPVVEAIPHKDDFYDFEARYSIGRTAYSCPADIPSEVAERAQALALAVFDLLGCAGVARIDLMLDTETQELFVLEANAVPGLTDTSLLPMAADAAEISFDDLVQRLLDLALEPAPVAL